MWNYFTSNESSSCLNGRLNSLKYLRLMTTFTKKKMKIFERIQKNLAKWDINPNSMEPNRFNWKIWMIFLLFGLDIFCNIMFIFLIEENRLMNYVNDFCIITVFVLVVNNLAVIVLQQSKLFEEIQRIEKIINKSNLFAYLIWISMKRNNLITI